LIRADNGQCLPVVVGQHFVRSHVCISAPTFQS
jgi:hypothetical protein